jgi:branched-chain amino acid transport system substrate-binding protein
MTELLDALAAQSGPGVIVIGTGADYIADIVKAVRRRGVRVPIIAAGGAGHEGYLQNFIEEPEEKKNPGFFTENLYASPPLIFDSAGTAAQTFAAAYTALAETSPSWVAAGAHDAARMLINALGSGGDPEPSGQQGCRSRKGAGCASRHQQPEDRRGGLDGPAVL